MNSIDRDISLWYVTKSIISVYIYVARRFRLSGTPVCATKPPLMSEEVYREKYSLANLFTPSSTPSVSDGSLRALWIPFPARDLPIRERIRLRSQSETAELDQTDRS